MVRTVSSAITRAWQLLPCHLYPKPPLKQSLTPCASLLLAERNVRAPFAPHFKFLPLNLDQEMDGAIRACRVQIKRAKPMRMQKQRNSFDVLLGHSETLGLG